MRHQGKPGSRWCVSGAATISFAIRTAGRPSFPLLRVKSWDRESRRRFSATAIWTRIHSAPCSSRAGLTEPAQLVGRRLLRRADTGVHSCAHDGPPTQRGYKDRARQQPEGFFDVRRGSVSSTQHFRMFAHDSRRPRYDWCGIQRVWVALRSELHAPSKESAGRELVRCCVVTCHRCSLPSPHLRQSCGGFGWGPTAPGHQVRQPSVSGIQNAGRHLPAPRSTVVDSSSLHLWFGHRALETGLSRTPVVILGFFPLTTGAKGV
jgi:hypothetical protein